VTAAMRVLPRDKSLNIRLGLALLCAGLLLVFWTFSGNQAYDIKFFYVAIVATALALYGTVLLANSRVLNERQRRVKARTATTAPPPMSGAEAKPAPASPAAAREWVRLQCPSCGSVFEEEGVRPFTAVCPNCKSSGAVA
jgi:hypothetical protein